MTFDFDVLVRAAGLDNPARDLAISGSTMRRYRQRGLTPDQADRLAMRVGLHPVEVWDDWINDAVAELERVCEGEDCDTRFVPSDGRQRYCTNRCYQRTWRRRALRERPELAERNRQARRAYYRAHGDYERARERRRKSARRRGEAA